MSVTDSAMWWNAMDLPKLNEQSVERHAEVEVGVMELVAQHLGDLVFRLLPHDHVVHARPQPRRRLLELPHIGLRTDGAVAWHDLIEIQAQHASNRLRPLFGAAAARVVHE